MSSASEQLDPARGVGTSEVGASSAGDSVEGYSLRFRQCFVPVLILLLVVALVSLCVGFYGYSKHGTVGVGAAAIAGVVCFLSASAALTATALTTNTPNALSGVLLGIILRTVIPFFVSILLMQAFKPLADAGLLGMVLVNYLVVLAAETLLAVRIVQANSSKG